ncbi:MAG: hypothetical protein IPP71_23420 [Bacteroidetes bacterium]|nr:hypothetical protein [Bacteroidota bacterium]
MKKISILLSINFILPLYFISSSQFLFSTKENYSEMMIYKREIFSNFKKDEVINNGSSITQENEDVNDLEIYGSIASEGTHEIKYIRKLNIQ